PSSLHSASIERSRARVSSSGRRTTIALEGLTIGPFSGEFQISIYAGSPLLHLEAVARTTEPDRAFYYDMGFGTKNADPGHRYAWKNTEGFMQSSATTDERPSPSKVRHRTIVLETGSGAIACFPPPHQFFFPRDYTDNLGYVWARPNGFGIRQT